MVAFACSGYDGIKRPGLSGKPALFWYEKFNLMLQRRGGRMPILQAFLSSVDQMNGVCFSSFLLCSVCFKSREILIRSICSCHYLAS